MPPLRPLIIAISLLLATSLHAAPRITGAWSWEFVNQGASISINTSLIDNTSKENATGTMQVQLWATVTPYAGGNISGKVIGSYKLDGIKPGQYYQNLRKVVDYTGPATKGTYFITLALTEFRNGSYFIVDWHNMSKTIVLAPLKPFTITGPFSWQSSYEGGTVDIKVAKISHHKKGTTGSLKLAVWATTAPYNGGVLKGWEIGSVIKDGLKPGYSYTDVKNTAKFIRPPAGTYHIVITLSEFGSDKLYHVVDYLSSGNTSTFK
jgi:hypothetical protein